MEKMLFSGVQSNSEVALIAIKGIKNQPGIAAKVFGAIAEEKINVELILQSIGRGENKDISFVVAQDEADHAVETLKKAFDEADYEDIISDKEVGIVSIVGAGMMSNSGAASKMFEALYNRGINIHLIYTSEIKITVLIKESRVERAVEALKEVGGQAFLCADHGNAEQLIDYETGAPFTAHTTNPVPFILINADPAYTLKEEGRLADIIPTMIDMMGMEKPAEMTGESLLIRK